MAKDIINPKDTTSIIQLNEAINEIETGVGFIKNSGLFREELTPRDAIIEQINKERERGMLGLTSRRERNKVKQTKHKQKAFAIQMPYQETIEEVAKEDVFQVAKSWNDATEEQVEDLYIEKMTLQRESIDKAHEFLYWTAAQGQTRDPKDGEVVLDMFEITGTTRPEVNLDLTDPTLNLLGWMGELRNQIRRANKRGSQEGVIEIFTTQAVFSAFVSHPSVLAAYQMAYQGRGKEFVQNAVSPFGTTYRGEYGFVSEFEHDGVRIVVAPQTFILEDGDVMDDGTYTGEFDAVAANTGFAVVRGVRDGYKAYFGQDNALDAGELRKVYAWRSPIIERAYFEITASSAPMAYTTVPELCFKFNFTV